MGEAKKRREKLTPAEQAGLDLTHKLMNEGKLIEGGFAIYLTVNKIAIDDHKVPLLYDCYMAGSEHLWQSLMSALDPDKEPTVKDMRRMDLIFKELTKWRDEKMAVIAKNYETKGSA